MGPLASIVARLKRPRRLNTIVLAAASSVVAAIALVFSLIAHQFMARETLATLRNNAETIARVAAQTNVNAYIVNDVVTMESALAQLVLLPGVENISLFSPDGHLLVWADRHNDRLLSGLGGEERVAPGAATRSPADTGQTGVYETWSTLDVGAPERSAHLRVRYDLGPRDTDLQRLWLESIGSTAIVVALVLLGLHLSLSRALQPIQALSAFARDMAGHIGRPLQLDSHCVEFSNLGAALSTASQSVASQIGRVQAILNTAADAVIGLDHDGVIVTLNPAASSILGRQEAELLHHRVQDFIPGLHRESLRSMFSYFSDDSDRAERVTRTDFLGTRADGTPFPIDLSLGLVRDDAGLRYVCIIRDVTDEQAFREFTELYERALSCTHNGVLISNAKKSDLPVVYVNEAFQEIIPLPLYQIFGRPMQEMLNIPTAEPQQEVLSGTGFSSRYTTSTAPYVKEGEAPRTIEVTLSPVRDAKNEITHYVGIISDITDRIHTQAILAERKRQLDAIFGLSPDGFVLFDGQNRMVFANPAFKRMTSLLWEDDAAPLSLSAFERFLHSITDQKIALESLAGEREDGTPEKFRLHMVRPQVRVLEAQLRRNAAGSKETILYIRDVTNEDAVDRMKSEFLASAAHELRTPMVSIFGFTELLLKRDYPVARQKDMLGTIHRQSGLLVKMINELLDLARIESRRGLDLKIDTYALLPLIDECVKGLMRDESERQVTISGVPEVRILMDPEKMHLALSNLLSNAFKYSPGGGDVRLAAHIARWSGRDFAVIEVSDSGIGMTDDQVARAFERFYRADASGNIPGTGLGLCLVKEIAELHKGRVELRSVHGVGTTASLWIPLADNGESAGVLH